MPDKHATPGVYINEGPQTPEQQALADAVFGNHDASMSKLTVVRIEFGQEEPEGEDQVTITRRPAGGYEFSGSVGIHAVDVVSGSATFVSGAISTDVPFPTADAAEAAAIEWAAEQGAETLHVLVADDA